VAFASGTRREVYHHFTPQDAVDRRPRTVPSLGEVWNSIERLFILSRVGNRKIGADGLDFQRSIVIARPWFVALVFAVSLRND
jgi:hypothetical protein